MAKNEFVKVRVLNAHPFNGKVFSANSLVLVPRNEVKALESGGIVDSSAAAVAYLEGEGVNVVNPFADEPAEQAE